MMGSLEEMPEIHLPDTLTTFESLPETICVSILSRLESMKFLAWCSTVCKRWYGLSQMVDTLRINVWADCSPLIHADRKLLGVTGMMERWGFAFLKRLIIDSHVKLPWLLLGLEGLEYPWLLEELKVYLMSEDENSLDKILLICKNLRHLEFSGQISFPNYCQAAPIRRLTSLTLFTVYSGDKDLECMLECCLELQTLRLFWFDKLDSPHICSSTLETLVIELTDDRSPESVIVDCPVLHRLQVGGVPKMQLAGGTLLSLEKLCFSSPCHLAFGSQGFASLHSLELAVTMEDSNFPYNWVCSEEVDKIIKMSSKLRCLVLDPYLPKATFAKLPPLVSELEMLHIGEQLFEALKVTIKEEEWRPCHGKLRVISVQVREWDEASVHVIRVLCCIATPVRLRIHLTHNTHDIASPLLALQQAHPLVDIAFSVSRPSWSLHEN